MKKRILSMLLIVAMVITMLPTVALAESGEGSNTHANHRLCGTGNKQGCDHTAISDWIAVSSLDELDGISGSSTVHYYLANDITGSKTVSISNGAEMTLCLNGNTLTGVRFFVSSGGTLNITDCGTNTTDGYIDPTTNKWTAVTTEGTVPENAECVSLTGGIITGCNSSPINRNSSPININNDNSAFNMYGGNIAGNSSSSGGAVYSDPNCKTKFNMYGGTICGNAATNYGGGVYFYTSVGEFNMSGGTISHNSAEQGGGIYNAGTFTMSGGTISHNSAGSQGGGIYNAGTFTMEGGVIKENYAKTGTGLYSSPNKTVILSGGAIRNNGGDKMKDSGLTANSGVYISSNNTVKFSGKVSIHGNKDANNNPKNLVVSNSSVIQLGADFKNVDDNGDQIPLGVAMYNSSTFTSGWSTHFSDKDYSDYFTAEETEKSVEAKIVPHNGELAWARRLNLFVHTTVDGCTFKKDGQEVTTAYAGDVIEIIPPAGKKLSKPRFVADVDLSIKTDSETGICSFTVHFNYHDNDRDYIMLSDGTLTVNTYNVTLNPNEGTITEGKNVAGYTYGVGAALPTESEITRDNYRFAGWYENADFSGSPVKAISNTATGNKIYYAKWVEQRTVTMTITGQEGMTYTSVNAKLESLDGGADSHEQTLTPADAATDPKEYSFTATVDAGKYQLTVTAKESGSGKNVTITEAVDLSNSSAAVTPTFTLPASNKSAVVEDNASLNITVSGLNDIANNQTVATGSERLEVKLTVSSGYDAAEDKDKIAAKAEADGNSVLKELDIDLTLHQYNAAGEPIGDPVDLGSDNTDLLEIIIPVDTAGKDKALFAVYRVHEGVLHALPYDGETFSVEDGFIRLSVKRFSSYAIAYGAGIPSVTPPAPPTPGSSDTVTQAPAPKAVYLGAGRFETQNVKGAPTQVKVNGEPVEFYPEENGFSVSLPELAPGRHSLTVVWGNSRLQTYFDYEGFVFGVTVPDEIPMDIPKTGENSRLGLCLGLMMLLGGAVVLRIGQRKKYKR